MEQETLAHQRYLRETNDERNKQKLQLSEGNTFFLSFNMASALPFQYYCLHQPFLS